MWRAAWPGLPPTFSDPDAADRSNWQKNCCSDRVLWLSCSSSRQIVFRTGQIFGSDNTGVIAGLNQNAFQNVLDPNLFAYFQNIVEPPLAAPPSFQALSLTVNVSSSDSEPSFSFSKSYSRSSTCSSMPAAPSFHGLSHTDTVRCHNPSKSHCAPAFQSRLRCRFRPEPARPSELTNTIFSAKHHFSSTN